MASASETIYPPLLLEGDSNSGTSESIFLGLAHSNRTATFLARNEQATHWRKPVRGHCKDYPVGTFFTAAGRRTLHSMRSLSAGSINLPHANTSFWMSTDIAHSLPRYPTDETNLNNECTCASIVQSYKDNIENSYLSLAVGPSSVFYFADVPCYPRPAVSHERRWTGQAPRATHSPSRRISSQTNPPAVRYVLFRRYSLCSWEAIGAGCELDVECRVERWMFNHFLPHCPIRRPAFALRYVRGITMHPTTVTIASVRCTPTG